MESHNKGGVWSGTHRRTCAALLLGVSLLGALVATAQVGVDNAPQPITVEALSPLVGGPTLITLKGKDIPLRVAVEHLLKATSLPIEGVFRPGDEARLVSVDWNNTPFWEAARDIENQTELLWYVTYSKSGAPLCLMNKHDFSFAQGGLVGLSSAQNPLIQVVATKVTHFTQSFAKLGDLARNGNPPQIDSFLLQLSAYFDPHIRVSPGSTTIKITTPQNFKGDATSGSSVSNTAVGISPFSVFLGNAGEQTKIPLIEGSLVAQVIIKSEPWEVPNVTTLKTATHKTNDGVYALNDVSLEGDMLTLRIAASTGVPQFKKEGESFTPSILTPRLFDGQGQEVSLASNTSLSPAKSEVVYSLRIASKDFPEGEIRPGPFKLVWDIPTEVKTLKVPFEFRDVPLP